MSNSAKVVNCSDVTLNLSEKMSKITLLDCHDIIVNSNSLITGIEITSCHNIKIIVTKNLPSLVIDKSDSIITYVPEESAGNLKITTAKSGDLNLVISKPNDSQYELHIPSQFEHTLDETLKNFIHKPSSFY